MKNPPGTTPAQESGFIETEVSFFDPNDPKPGLKVIPNQEKTEVKRIDMGFLARALQKHNASDLHIKVGRPPLYRINGKLIPAKMDRLSHEQVQAIVVPLMNDKHRKILDDKRSVDFSFRIKDLGRFRCCAYFQRNTLAAAVRVVPLAVPSIDALALPAVLKELAHKPRGLILVTGPTGSGKSTTMAAILQHINENRQAHVLCIEDPIEYVYADQKASMTQREIGADANNFHEALVAGLRQDPDVIALGELRDADVIQSALVAAETGHLVLSTLHTTDAISTIDRVVDAFSPDARDQIRLQLAGGLLAVISQQLLPRKDGTGMIPVCEVLVKSPSVEDALVKNEIFRIPDILTTSSDYYKMQSFNQDLVRLVNAGVISSSVAVKASNNPEDLKLQLSGVARGDSAI